MEIVLAGMLLILILLTLAAALGLGWLRAREPRAARRLAELKPRARNLVQEFSQQARRQMPDPGPPYTPLLTQAGLTGRRGWARAKALDARLMRGLPAVAPRPRREWIKVYPIYQEWFSRLGLEYDLWEAERQVRQAEGELAATHTLLADAAQLGKREQATLERLQAETGTLKEAVAAHPLTGALAAEQKKLADLGERLILAGARLGEAEPSPSDVARAYPDLLEIEKGLESIRQSLRGHESSQQRLRPQLERAAGRLAAFETALSQEETRRPMPRLCERTQAARQDLAALQGGLARGDYASVEERLSGLNRHLKEMEEALKQVSALRDRQAELQEQTGQTLSGLHQWIRQYPAPFILDSAQEWVRVLQTRLQEQARATASEDPLELERVSQVPFDEIRRSQSGFEQGIAVVERLGDRLDPAALAGLHKRGEHLAARLKLRHPAYQEKARLPQLEEHLARLDEGWQLIADADPNRQSDLIRIGQVLQQVDAAWNEVERDIQRAFAALELAKTQQEEALRLLEDEAFGGLRQLSQPEQDEWAQAASDLLALRQPLLERAGRGEEDFGAVLNEVDTLRKEAAKFVRDVQFRLAHFQLETAKLVEQLNGLAGQLEALEGHPYLDFEERSAETLAGLRRWLGQAQTPALAGLGRWSALAEQGALLRQEGSLLARALESESAAADKDRAWTEDLLITAEEYQGSARAQQPPNSFNGELASARSLLEMARRKLQALTAPRKKYELPEYQAGLADVRQMIVGARSHVDVALSA